MISTQYHQYTKADLFVNPTDPQLPYRRRNDEEKTSVHWGQRKLLLTLVQFLTLFWDPRKIKKPVVVYAGAAPGTNIGIVSTLFPEVEFHLYDPAPFKIKSNEKIHLYQQYFTDNDAARWTGRSDILFISDIRTADYTKTKNLDENEAQIMKDMDMQMRWFTIINPVSGQLKFRPPYTGGTRPAHIKYLYGYVFRQPWAPQTTTEGRLVPVRGPDGKWLSIAWSTQKYQDQMFHLNVIVRETYKYVNPFDQSNKPIDSPELLNDWDSRTEAQIWIDYLMKRTGNAGKQTVVALSRLITKQLTDGSRYKDTLQLLRSKPRSIKHRNLSPSRDDRNKSWTRRPSIQIKGNTNKPSSDRIHPPINPEITHVKPTLSPSLIGRPTKTTTTSKLATDIGLK